MQKLLKNWVKHIVAILILLVATVVYFSPSVIDGKVLRQGDNIKATGMGASQMKQYEETAQPGEFSAWSDAMFGWYALCGYVWKSGSRSASIQICR